MGEVAHLIGNGKSSGFYVPDKGLKITCNLPPFKVDNLYTTVMVDFKMMNAIWKGEVVVPGDWVLGARPHKWMEMRNDFYMKYSKQIKEFYLTLPRSAQNYTDFNCGHMACHYAANKVKADEVHLYGFDSIFDFNLRSCSDFYLGSDRGNQNNNRLANNWRPVWQKMFNEFPNTKFILHHIHDAIKFQIPSNVSVKTYEGKAKMV